MSSIQKNYIYESVAALSSLLFPLISFPYLTQTLGPAAIGKVNYIDFLTGLIIAITSFGIPLFGKRETARLAGQPVQQRLILSRMTGLWTVTGLIGIAFFLLFLLNHPWYGTNGMLIGLGCIYILTNILAADWFLQGRESFGFLAIRNIGLRCAGLIALFLLVRTPSDYVTYYAIIVCTQLLIIAINYGLVRPSPAAMRPAAVWKEHKGMLTYFFILSSFITIYDFTDTVILGLLRSDETVGFYTVAMKLVRMSLVLILAANTIIYPRMAHAIAEADTEKARYLLQRSIVLVMTLAIPAGVLYYVLAPQLIQVFAGNAFSESVVLVQWLAPLPLLIALSNLFLLYHLSAVSRGTGMWKVVLGIFTMNLLVNTLLISEWGPVGAAITSLATEGVIMGVFWKRTKWEIPVRPALQILASALAMIPVIQVTRDTLQDPVQQLIAAGCAGGVTYLLIQRLVFRNPFFTGKWFL